MPLTCRSFTNIVSIYIAFDTFLYFVAYIFAAYYLLLIGYVSSASINLILVYPLIKQRCVIIVFSALFGAQFCVIGPIVCFFCIFDYVLLVAFNGRPSLLDAFIHGSCRPSVDFFQGVGILSLGVVHLR